MSCATTHVVTLTAIIFQLYWPRKAYKTKLERAFRGLHIVRIPRCAHNHIHKTTSPPQKPSVAYMKQVIRDRTGVLV